MQKICALVLLSILASNLKALPQTKWSRQIHNSQGQLTRERRQFPFGEWIPLNQPCLSCRPLADPLDVGLRSENIGLTPPRPPTVTRQIHGEGNFFPQDESSILSVPPPPPSAVPVQSLTNTNGNFQFSNFGQFNAPLAVPTQKIFPQTQQVQFLPQTFLSNQPVLVNRNQQILSSLNTQNNLFNQGQSQQQINNGKVTSFTSDFKTQKLPENVVLEQNKRPVAPKQAFGNKPQPFTPSQNLQQTFVQQHSVNFESSILTPPPAPNNGTQNIVIPGLDKEEIQLLYVPVETLRQRGTAQEQLLTQQPQNIQFFNRGNKSQRPTNNIRPTEQTIVTQPKGHFVTQNGKSQGQADGSLKVTSTQPFPTAVTPSTLFVQHLPFQQTPQPFVSATPATPTIHPFVTPASVFQKFSPFTPQTTLSHLPTVPSTVQFSQSNIQFGTTPKNLINQEIFKEEITNGKSQFSELKTAGLNLEEERPLQQSFINQPQAVTQPPLLSTTFSQEQNEPLIQNQFPHQINQQQIALQKQQEQFLQRQRELEAQKFADQQRKQKELEDQRAFQQQRQKELEQQKLLQKQKELEEQRLNQQRQKELEQQQYLQKQKELEQQQYLQKQKELEQQQYLQKQKELEQQQYLQKQKELEEQRLLQQRQKELEQQQYLKKQKELEEQRLLQQRQKELEQQQYLQKQKELEEQRLLQQRQKELEQQRFLQKQKELEERLLQQQRQRELEEQRFLQEQRRKELENQRRIQLQKQKELDEKRRLKQKEDEQRLLRFQQQQKELDQQRLYQQQQEEQHLLLQQQKLQKQKQENLKKQQQYQFFQQQQQQQQKQQALPQQEYQQPNRHILPTNDNLNLIPELEKESEADDQLVPHQPPLSVFFKNNNGGEARITDVLRELRSSSTITVLDQYFEKMPKVFVGPAGLIPPPGYGKFELPYLSNLETNRIEKTIDKLPFFVAPLNFVPPPGYAKIPFPAPHIGSVVVSSESNSAMTVKLVENEPEEENKSFPVVGPEIPGLINNLNTVPTTIKPTTHVSTPSLPQTTAQLRNRRPNSSLYKLQNRKPITRTRPTTTNKPEEEVTQSIQKTEVTKDSENGFRKPFNRFLNRRRQQVKTTTESIPKGQFDGKSLENRHYSVEVYHQEKNQFPRTQQKIDSLPEKQNGENQFNRQFDHSRNIDRITPSGHGVFEVRPTVGFSHLSQTSESTDEERRPEAPDYADINLQTFEEGPLPTGSAKTITQELYRPNAINQEEVDPNSKAYSKSDSTKSSFNYQPGIFESVTTAKFSETPGVSPTADVIDFNDASLEKQTNLRNEEFEEQDGSAEGPDTTKILKTKSSSIHDPPVGEKHTQEFLGSNEQYTSAFAEISKPHHIPGFIDYTKRQQSKFLSSNPTQETSVDLETHSSKEQQAQEFDISGEVKPTQSSTDFSSNKFLPTGSSAEYYSTALNGGVQHQQSLYSSNLNPTAPGTTAEQQKTSFLIDSQNANARESGKHSEDHRIGSFISFHNVQSTSDFPVNPQQYFPSSTAHPSQPTVTDSENHSIVEQNQSQASPTPETLPEVTINPSVQAYTPGFSSENPVQVSTEVTINPSVQTYTSRFSSEGSVHVSEDTQSTQGQDGADKLPNDHRLKLPNPSIVRVRTRLRGKSRGQVNFTASQSTTPVSLTRSEIDYRQNENSEQEHSTRANHLREYHPIKTSKYNQFRGVKKPVRTTTESTEEYEQKANVYTIRPQRRPLNPSTVSTKRIRRPTTPLPSLETATEAFGSPTGNLHSQSEHSDISPSGVSNDVYYEQSSLSSVKHKLRQHFGSAEQKNDFVPAYVSTSYPFIAPTYSTFAQDEYSQDPHGNVGDLTQTARPSENSEKYPEWNPSESGFDVSGIILTTIRTPGSEEQQELEEPKKPQDNKKAFDPDLEKKNGRRRVRVRVHKRPHENFETAESQNLRTVANVLVPPTTTYKPNDESAIHQLAKNADFSFGGQKLFGIRSREYFRKRLNLTQSEEVSQNKEENEENKKTNILNFDKKSEKAQKNGSEPIFQTDDTNDGNKFVRPKFRGFVRKVIKHGGSSKETTESEWNKVPEYEDNERKHDNSEFRVRQPFRVNQGGFNNTGRTNSTRHKTFVRYVKKNRVKQPETEAHVESNSHELQKEHEELSLLQTTEPQMNAPEFSQTSNAESDGTESQNGKEEGSNDEISSSKSLPDDLTEEVRQQHQITQETNSERLKGSSSERSPQATTPLNLGNGLYFTQKSKFYQTLRPVYQRTTQSGFQRTKEPQFHSSTIEQVIQEPQEKRNGITRSKFGKTTTSATNKDSAEIKEINEQQVKDKRLHTLEVRKYLRTKNREGAFSQFSKNKYFSSEKKESKETSKDQESTEKDFEEITTDRTVNFSSKTPETTQAFAVRTDSLEVQTETEQNDEKSEFQVPTTEAISSLEEEDEEEESSQEEDTSSVSFEATTETESPTTVPHSEPNKKVTELKNLAQSTEKLTEPEHSAQSTEKVTELKNLVQSTEKVIDLENSEQSTEKVTELKNSVQSIEKVTELKNSVESTEKVTELENLIQPTEKDSELKNLIESTEKMEDRAKEYQPDIYRFSENSFTFDEAEKFTGTKNRAHVRNITTDIIENTASFSAPGVEKRPYIRVATHQVSEEYPKVTELHSEKTEVTTAESNDLVTTTDYPETAETEATVSPVTKSKISKILKTSTTTKISHETEICYRGKCIRTKSENPDEDLKLLVDSASTMKIEKTKT